MHSTDQACSNPNHWSSYQPSSYWTYVPKIDDSSRGESYSTICTIDSKTTEDQHKDNLVFGVELLVVGFGMEVHTEISQ